MARSAYTLLEVLIATAVGVLLMGALYMAINVQIRYTEIGREVVEQAQLVRAVFARIDSDIRLSLGPPLPSSSSSSSSSGSSSSSSGSGTSGSGSSSSTTGTSGTSTTGSGSSTGSNSSSSSSAAPGGNGPVQFNLWVQGDTNWVMLYISRVPRELNPIPGSDNADQQMVVSDLRRVSYWLAGGDSPSGLARQEITAVTSPDAISNVPPNIPDDDPTVVLMAPEVKSLTFSYWDGTTWQDTWDGTQPGPDGNTPVGPPLAIAVTLGIAPSGSENNTGSDQLLKQYRHVVPIITANGAIQLSTGGTTTTQ
jgi:hypothetical protein